LQKKSDSAADETGVWVETKKIASLGIAVKKWVTYHGAAINFSRDEKAFKGINPCGFSSNIMTTVEDQSPNFPTLSEFKIALAKTLLKSL
jgi:lipoyl(octanoyl) transferase